MLKRFLSQLLRYVKIFSFNAPQALPVGAKSSGFLSNHVIHYVLIAFLLSIAIIYCGTGFYRLGFNNNIAFACDLHLRWAENKAVVSGETPFQPLSTLSDMNHYELFFNNVTEDWVNERSIPHAVYPPWSYSLSMLFVIPAQWSIARTWFTICCMISFVLIAWTSYSLMRAGFSRIDSGFFTLSLFANISIVYCLSNGQYGILIAALLLGCLYCWNTGHTRLAGIFLGFSAIKPQISLLFFLIPCVQKEWRLLCSAVIVVGLSTLFCCVMIDINPLTMLSVASHNAKNFIDTSQSFIPTMVSRFAGRTGILFLAISIFSFSTFFLYRFRHCHLLTLFAICSVGSVSWTYCKAYDYPVLIMLNLALLLSFAKTKSRHFIYCCFTLSLTMIVPLPMRYHNHLIIQFIYSTVCITSLLILLTSNSTIIKPHTFPAIFKNGKGSQSEQAVFRENTSAVTE